MTEREVRAVIRPIRGGGLMVQPWGWEFYSVQTRGGRDTETYSVLVGTWNPKLMTWTPKGGAPERCETAGDAVRAYRSMPMPEKEPIKTAFKSGVKGESKVRVGNPHRVTKRYNRKPT